MYARLRALSGCITNVGTPYLIQLIQSPLSSIKNTGEYTAYSKLEHYSASDDFIFKRGQIVGFEMTIREK